MCIRDRQYAVRDLPGSGGRHDARQLDLERAPSPLLGRFSGCLLYTSDAADERSSVDLGGRRIIKKTKYD